MQGNGFVAQRQSGPMYIGQAVGSKKSKKIIEKIILEGDIKMDT